MREQLEARLRALEEEFEKGRTMLQEAERHRAELEARMLRIDGGIAALREVLQEVEAANGRPDAVEVAARPS